MLASKLALDSKLACNTAGGSHHATFDCGAGYCVFNDVAVAANYLKNKNYAKKILIVDLDVHQGNGNSEIFKNIKVKSYKASEELAKLYGEPEVLKGYGRRNATLNAIAPTTSSAFILGQVSQGIEPIWSNSYVKDIAKIKTTIKNPFLVKLLEEKGMNTPEVWRSIRDFDGSVQHLEFLTENERDVFKTYPEIDQMTVIYQAANRQNHIDQGQSINVMVHPDMPTRDLNNLYMTAWSLGIKSMYYQHSMNAAQKFKQKKECASCEG